MDNSAEPDQATAHALFKQLEEMFPTTTLGEERWYLLAIAALTGSGQAAHAATLYTYIVSKPQYASSEARKCLIRRLREALVKCISIIGVCRPLEAIIDISEVEREEDKDYSCSRCINRDRGVF
ncbi:MAG: hypothetical protein Q9163_004492 [Psora crenata]